MPELTDEHVENLFAELRATQLHQVRPPGAAVVHATVRRRRTTASVTAGVVLAVTGVTAAGAAGLVPLPGLERRPAQAPFDSRTLVMLTGTAGAAVHNRNLQPVNQTLTGQVALTDSYSRVEDVLAGTYLLKMVCVGEGRTNVMIDVGRQPDGSSDAGEVERVEMPCTPQADADVEAVTVVVPPTGHLRVEAHPDRAAEGRSAFAYEAVLSLADQQRLARHADTARAEGTYEADAVGTSAFMTTGITADKPIRGGSYRLEMACVGTGTISGRLETDPGQPANDIQAFDSVVCSDGPRVVTLAFTKEGDRAMRLTMQPDDAALGQSAVAYRIVPD
ncbi:MAG TPA: hypothetical protein VF657_12860 [Actinoplanes sp.]